jgi:hypothetical protein
MGHVPFASRRAMKPEAPATTYLGCRRPSSLADFDQYREIEHAKTEPAAHDNAPGVHGYSMTGRGGNGGNG